MRVLYIEDAASDADLARHELARIAPEIELEIVSTLTALLIRLAGPKHFDLLLSALALSDGSGLQALSYVREHALPLAAVILTGSDDQEAAVAAIKAGSDDYLVKRGNYLERLPLALQTALDRFRDSAQRRSRVLKVLYAEHNSFDVDLMRCHLIRHAPYIHLTTVSDVQEVS